MRRVIHVDKECRACGRPLCTGDALRIDCENCRLMLTCLGSAEPFCNDICFVCLFKYCLEPAVPANTVI